MLKIGYLWIVVQYCFVDTRFKYLKNLTPYFKIIANKQMEVQQKHIMRPPCIHMIEKARVQLFKTNDLVD